MTHPGEWLVGDWRNENVLECNENKNTTYQNLWDIADAMIRGKFIVRSAYIKKKKGFLSEQSKDAY
jgi:hypothetical protein